MRVGVQRRAPAVLPPKQNSAPIAQETGGSSGPVWTGAENLVTTGFRTLNRPAPSESLSRLTSRWHCISKFWVWVDVVSFSYTFLTIYTLQRKPILEKQAEASALRKCQTFIWFRLFDQTDVEADLATWGKSHTEGSGKWHCAKYDDLENKNLQNFTARNSRPSTGTPRPTSGTFLTSS